MKKLLLILLILHSSAWALTRAQIRSQMKQLTVNESNSFHPDSTLNVFIDRSINTVSELCSCVVKQDTVVGIGGTKEYTLNSDFSKIRSVYSKVLKKTLTLIQDKDVGL